MKKIIITAAGLMLAGNIQAQCQKYGGMGGGTASPFAKMQGRFGGGQYSGSTFAQDRVPTAGMGGMRMNYGIATAFVPPAMAGYPTGRMNPHAGGSSMASPHGGLGNMGGFNRFGQTAHRGGQRQMPMRQMGGFNQFGQRPMQTGGGQNHRGQMPQFQQYQQQPSYGFHPRQQRGGFNQYRSFGQNQQRYGRSFIRR